MIPALSCVWIAVPSVGIVTYPSAPSVTFDAIAR